MPSPTPNSSHVVALSVPSLSGEEAQLLKFAAAIGEGKFATAELDEKGEFGNVTGKGKSVEGGKYAYTLQLRPVPPIEVPASLQEFCKVQHLVEPLETDRSRTRPAPGFSGLPVILLARDESDSRNPKLNLHGAIFAEQDATVIMPRTPLKPRWEQIVASETCGVAQLSSSNIKVREPLVELPSRGGALTCSAENGSYSFAFKGDSTMEGRTVWFAILKRDSDEVLAQGRSDGGRAQGSVELESNPEGGVSAEFDRSFSLPEGGRLIFILEPKTKN